MIRLLGENNSPHFLALYIICSFEGASQRLRAWRAQSVSLSQPLTQSLLLSGSLSTHKY